MTLKQAVKRIEELERQVRELQARPPIVINNQPPTFAPPQVDPSYWQPHWPIRWGEITCGTIVADGDIPQN